MPYNEVDCVMSGQNYSRIYTIIHPEILELRDITISVYFTSSDELLYIQVLQKKKGFLWTLWSGLLNLTAFDKETGSLHKFVITESLCSLMSSVHKLISA